RPAADAYTWVEFSEGISQSMARTRKRVSLWMLAGGTMLPNDEREKSRAIAQELRGDPDSDWPERHPGAESGGGRRHRAAAGLPRRPPARELPAARTHQPRLLRSDRRHARRLRGNYSRDAARTVRL